MYIVEGTRCYTANAGFFRAPSVSAVSETSKQEHVSFFSPSFLKHNGTNLHITIGCRGLPSTSAGYCVEKGQNFDDNCRVLRNNRPCTATTGSEFTPSLLIKRDGHRDHSALWSDTATSTAVAASAHTNESPSHGLVVPYFETDR